MTENDNPETEAADADKPAKLPAAVVAEQRKAHIEGLKVEHQLLSGRTDEVGKRRLAEVADQLDKYDAEPAKKAAARGRGAAKETA